AIGANLIRGRRPACHCFGRLDASPIGWQTLVRNAVFAAVAGLLIWAGPADNDWTLGPAALQTVQLVGLLVLLVFVVAEGWLFGHLLRQNGRLLVRLEALEHRLAS